METINAVVHAWRLKKLATLLLSLLIFWIAVTELAPYLDPSQRVSWWFWTSNGILAIGFCLGILFSFWWVPAHAVERRSYFVYLCFFLFCFFANATKGLTVVAFAKGLLNELQVNEFRSCKTEALICHNFISSTDPDRRGQWASTFFGVAGVNLLRNKTDGSISKPPSEIAGNNWVQRQKANEELRETFTLFAQLNNAALSAFALNGIVALLVLGLGGFWLGRRQ